MAEFSRNIDADTARASRGRLSVNMLATIALHAANGLYPLVTLYYLASAIPEKDLAYLIAIESIVLLQLIVVLYSYEITSTLKIIKNKERHAIRNQSVYSNTLYSRMLLYAISLIPALGVCIYAYDCSVYLMLFTLPLFQLFFSLYAFNALSKNIYPAIVVVLVRAGGFLSITFLVSDSESLQHYVFVQVATAALIAAACMYFMHVKCGLHMQRVKLKSTWTYTKQSFPAMQSIIGVALYRDINIPVLAFFGMNPNFIVAYALFEKIVKAFQAVQRPIVRALLPQILGKFGISASYGQMIRATAPMMKWPVALTAFMSLLALVVLHSDHFSSLTSSSSLNVMSEYRAHLSLMALAPFAGVINYIYGILAYQAMGKQKIFRNAVLLTGFLNVITIGVAVLLNAPFLVALAFGLIEYLLIYVSYMHLRRSMNQ